MNEQVDAGMWQVEIDDKQARYRVAILKDWVSMGDAEGRSISAPEPFFVWSSWIVQSDHPSDLKAMAFHVQEIAEFAARRATAAMERKRLSWEPIRLEGRAS